VFMCSSQATAITVGRTLCNSQCLSHRELRQAGHAGIAHSVACSISAVRLLMCSHGEKRAAVTHRLISSVSLQVMGRYRGQREIPCPRCSALFSVSSLDRLPLHKKICGLVRLQNKFRADPSAVMFQPREDAIVRVEDGHPVYQGVVHPFVSVGSIVTSPQLL
jgi:hypothetical protein